MKNLIIILISCFVLSGCSLIPKVNFNTKNTVPKLIGKSKYKTVCKGKMITNQSGDIISCSKGYYSYNSNFNKEERRMTLKERILSFFRNLVGYSFWIIIGLLIFAPSALAFIVGRIMEGLFGVSRKALESTVRAVKKAKNNGGKYMEELDKEHGKNKKVKKVINEIRGKI